MKRHRCDIYKIADETGIRIKRIDRRYRGDLKPRDCFAKWTLRAIGRRHGERHLALIIRLIVESEGNAGELYRETLMAISALVIQCPELVERGGRLFDQLDRLDLGAMRRRAKTMKIGVASSAILRVLLALELLDEPVA